MQDLQRQVYQAVSYTHLRNPSNPAVVSEIDGEVTMGKIKRGNREIIVTSKTGEVKKYLVALSKQILVPVSYTHLQ